MSIKEIYLDGCSAGRYPMEDDPEAYEDLWNLSEAKKITQSVRISLIKIAADLLSGKWVSTYEEDLPPRTPKAVIRGLKTDAKRRCVMAQLIKVCVDRL